MHEINLTAFIANRMLVFVFDPPDNLFSGPNFSMLGENSIYVKDFLNAGLMSNTGWFGLHLKGNEGCCWSQATNTNEQSDAAKARLVIDYAETATVPEPATYALFCLGFFGFAVSRQKSLTSGNKILTRFTPSIGSASSFLTYANQLTYKFLS